MKIDRLPPGFSWPIDIRGLERETRRFLGVGLIAGLLALVALGLAWRHERAVSLVRVEVIPAPPVKTRFIELPPRDRAVLSVRPHPFVKRVLRPFTGRPGFSTMPLPGQSSGRIPGITERTYEYRPDTPAPPEIRLDIDSRDFSATLPDSFSFGGRFHPGDFSMSEELITVETLLDDEETRYRGIIFLKPGSPRTMRGIVPVPSIYTSTYPYIPLSEGMGGLAKAAKVFTSLELVFPRSPIHLGTNIPMRYPFLYIGIGETWEYLPREAKEVGTYLKSGGFAVFENLSPSQENSPAEASLRQFIIDALGPSVHMAIIPNDHPLYHCFFDFPEGPPQGAEVKALSGFSDNRIRKPVNCLEGVWIGPRMVAIYSNKGYGTFWPDDSNSDPQRKMGINMLVFALLQEGGKIEKRYDRTLEPGVAVQRWMSGEVQPLSGGGRNGDGAVGGGTGGGSRTQSGGHGRR